MATLPEETRDFIDSLDRRNEVESELIERRTKRHDFEGDEVGYVLVRNNYIVFDDQGKWTTYQDLYNSNIIFGISYSVKYLLKDKDGLLLEELGTFTYGLNPKQKRGDHENGTSNLLKKYYDSIRVYRRENWTHI